MKNSYLPIIIKRLAKRTKKIIYIDDLKKMIQEVMLDEYLQKRAYKILYYLKKKWHLISLKKSIFFIKDPDDDTSEQDIVENRYRPLLHKHCSNISQKSRYISWFKALQIQFNDLSIPDEIQVVTLDQQRQEVVIAERIVQFKKYTSKKQLLYKHFKKHTTKYKLKTNSFLIANKELAVLEVLYNFDSFENQYEYEYLKKVMKKYKAWDTTVREQVLKLWKHHTSANRLYELLSTYHPKVAEKLMESIKRYGFVL